jgi:F-type H+-transporting ATPase subunit a
MLQEIWQSHCISNNDIFNTNLTANKITGTYFLMPGVPKVWIVSAPIEQLGILLNLFIDDCLCKYFAGHIVLMSIIGLMFILKANGEAVYLFGLSFVFYTWDIGSFFYKHIFTMLSALYFSSACWRTSSWGGLLKS